MHITSWIAAKFLPSSSTSIPSPGPIKHPLLLLQLCPSVLTFFCLLSPIITYQNLIYQCLHDVQVACKTEEYFKIWKFSLVWLPSSQEYKQLLFLGSLSSFFFLKIRASALFWGLLIFALPKPSFYIGTFQSTILIEPHSDPRQRHRRHSGLCPMDEKTEFREGMMCPGEMASEWQSWE